MRSRTTEKLTAFAAFVLIVVLVAWGVGVLVTELGKRSASGRIEAAR